ncbi:HET-domain-containing protein [Aaosphaeria arxii CBS 175.79]|uniref:HET-domain-containing protein n=1 Tax=Aaosphaeria arxii CBS 175.79 TaxID=1450172 RepID=A0A6A5XI74_9PLEO|nr:HET-domain-containing protein [Aaosphaeria arxii CBS 175.79]KAF2012965.1 HET-domain-containing protein [Aaosphaeria arxii CBS 175.79]
MFDLMFFKLIKEDELAGDSQDRVDVIYEYIDQLPKDAPICVKECSATSTGHLGPLLQAHLSDKNNIKVVTMEGHPSGAPYATLSYCWGPNPQFLRLTAENYNQLRGDIAISTLPQTFRDAILVTQTLGLSYLWIDSLCILQEGPGSEEDWLFHLHDMADIFSNCHVCISADNGANPHKGLFSKRDHTLIQPLFFKATVVKDPVMEIYLTLNPKSQCSFAFADAPLWKRGWVTQERILSPRILHFGRDQLFWECAGIRLASETFPCDKDKLNALAGIAKQVARASDDSYHAGVFKKHLPEQLLWRSTKGFQADNLRGPSWSWASHNGQINFGPIILYRGSGQWGVAQQVVARLVDIHTWPWQENGNRWDGAQGGVISLVAPIVDVAEISLYNIGDDFSKTVHWDEVSSNDCATLYREVKAVFILTHPVLGPYTYSGLIIGRNVAEEDYRRLGVFTIIHLNPRTELATKIEDDNFWKLVRII